ncbi:MAG: hypothetical protein AAF962_04395 [Actinomycetota bacterium]
MALRKLTSTNAFVFVDLDDAPATGVVRRARKILQGGAKDLARSATYTFGAFGVERSGASAGINAEGDDIEGAIGAFVEELTPDAAAGSLEIVPAKGVSAAQLAPLRAASPGGPLAGSADLLAAGVVTAAAWAVGGDLAGRSVAIEGEAQLPEAVRTALTDAGASVVNVWGADEKPWLVWGADVDVVLAGSKAGILNHQGTPAITAKAVVPWGPLPVTTKAFAQLHRAGEVTVVPDFLSTAGPLMGGLLGDDLQAASAAFTERLISLLDDAASDADGLLLGACYRAEAFIAEWSGSKPFGRPLAA